VGAPYKALVAFTAVVKDAKDGQEYTEAKMNGFPEAATGDRFEGDEYRFLIVRQWGQICKVDYLIFPWGERGRWNLLGLHVRRPWSGRFQESLPSRWHPHRRTTVRVRLRRHRQSDPGRQRREQRRN